jgi:molybdate transport system ATP-binding protein
VTVSNSDTTPVLSFEVTVERPGFTLNASGEFGHGITSVFGPSGAGKSTLLGVLAGIVAPSRGSVSLNGRTLYSSTENIKLPPERRRMGIVYQDAALFPHMTVEQNLQYGYRLTPAKERRLNPADLVDLLHISRLLKRKPDDLSGGEKQRVALARTLATSPEMLLLDEPMSALDLRLRGIVIGYLKTVHRELSIPMIYVSHSISEVIAISDMVMILDAGNVKAFDRPRRLLGSTSSTGDSEDAHDIENILDGRVVESHTGGGQGVIAVSGTRFAASTGGRDFGEKVVMAIGAREIIIASAPPQRISARNIIPGKVISVSGEGDRRIVTVDCGPELMVEVTVGAITELGIQPGAQVHLVIKSGSISVMDAFRS